MNRSKGGKRSSPQTEKSVQEMSTAEKNWRGPYYSVISIEEYPVFNSNLGAEGASRKKTKGRKIRGNRIIARATYRCKSRHAPEK